MGTFQTITNWARYRNLPDEELATTAELQVARTSLLKRFTGESIGSLLIFGYGYGAAVADLVQHHEQSSVAVNLGIALVGTVIGVESVTETWGRHNRYRDELLRRDESVAAIAATDKLVTTVPQPEIVDAQLDQSPAVPGLHASTPPAVIDGLAGNV